MNPIYKFYLRIGEAGTEVLANPIYKDDLTLDYEQESGQKFFRAKLNGKLTFILNDYEVIMNAPFDTTYTVVLKKSVDMGQTWLNYWQGTFMRTDCTVDTVNKKVVVSPTITDDYNDVLAGMEKEYNLAELPIAVDKLLIAKRPLIQVYKLGDNIISCFLLGSSWEQDVTEPITKDKEIRKKYFSLAYEAMEISVTEATEPKYNGVYLCTQPTKQGGNTIYICRRKDDDKCYIKVTKGKDGIFDISTIVLYDDYVEKYAALASNVKFNNEYLMSSVSGGTGTMKAYVNNIDIYMRLLLDKPNISTVSTYEIGSNDIVENNRNYRYAIGYRMGNISVTLASSKEPTEYGRRDDGRYFQKPTEISDNYFPVARTTWLTASIWFSFVYGDEWADMEGRTSYLFKDAYELGSCINVLLKQFSDITFDSNEECSQFLYSERNPLTRVNQRLYITQKSNVLIGEYQEPARKAICTLRSILTMLKDAFRCYWYIEDKKLHIEHVSYFNNGGTYDNGQVVGYDLTRLLNVRNGKSWDFAKGEYSFDKVDMAERYQFGWADDSTKAFDGLPIEIKSNYVQKGKIEEITIGGFTSDVDLMLLNPNNMSKDGFAIFAATPARAIFKESEYFPTYYDKKNGEIEKRWSLKQVGGHRVRLTVVVRQHVENGIGYTGTATLRLYREKEYTDILTINTSAQEQVFQFVVPKGYDIMTFYVNGWVDIRVDDVEVVDGLRELPFYSTMINGVEYKLQNGLLSFAYLQPAFYKYDLPASKVIINGLPLFNVVVDRKKKQTISFPAGLNDPNPNKLVKTSLGNGQFDKISVNLCSRMVKATLKYDTEQ
jgi:hypothetical protein|nr:MAG TPA: hypothetical protein [Caudoviricetes sp.]